VKRILHSEWFEKIAVGAGLMLLLVNILQGR